MPVAATDAIDLLFSQPPLDGSMPIELVFGDDDAGPDIPTVLVHAAGRITGLRLPLLVRLGVRALAAGRITGLRHAIGAGYDVNTARPLVSLAQAPFQAAQRVDAGALSGLSAAPTRRTGPIARWQSAAPQINLAHARWQAIDHLLRGAATVSTAGAGAATGGRAASSLRRSWRCASRASFHGWV